MKRIVNTVICAAFCFAAYSQTNISEFQTTANSIQKNSNSLINSNTQVVNKQQKNTVTNDESLNSVSQLLPNPQLAMSSPDYQVTAGDVYSLVFAAGTTPVSYTIPIDTSYKVRVANLAVINGAGLTYQQLKTQVEAIVTKNYPLSGVQFVLSAPAQFKVIVKGEVTDSEEINAWALTRLSTIIKSKMTVYSSIRNVSVTSSSGNLRTYDLFRAERFGEMQNDPYLRPGDSITLNHVQRIVFIEGSVERPGKYELLENENLKDLIENYGGGLAPLADTSRIQIYRIKGEKDAGKIYYPSADSITANLQLLDYDTVTIASFNDTTGAIFIEGAVSTGVVSTNLEGASRVVINFYTGETYSSLVRKNKNLFSASSDTENAYIIRTTADGVDSDNQPKFKTEKIPINLNQILFDSNSYNDLKVLPNDTLLVPFRQFFVSVAGAVNTPGRFPYIPDRDWNYYVGLAGGIDSFRNTLDAVKIIDKDGKKIAKSEPIPPEATITVKENSVWYKWTKVSGGLTAILTVVSTVLSIMVVTGAM